MPITRPSVADVVSLARRLGMRLSPEEAESYRALMAGNLDGYDTVEAEPDEVPAVTWPRTPGYRPGPVENRLGAWARKTVVNGAGEGPLAGRTAVLKDNIALAGVPMMNGASTLQGFVPVTDATLATRMLDAGVTILGKAVSEHFCLSGGSHTSDPAPVHNPRRMGYSAGGSSSGSAALVASGEVDFAIGGDQGGSVRIPAAYCGIVGLKPTHGLVPYTGVMPIEATLDHVGPMTTTVSDNALLLSVVAGEDGLDPRQYAPRVDDYVGALGDGVEGLRIGLLIEGFDLSGMQRGVADSVRAGAARLAAAGAIIEDVSVPEHTLGAAVWAPIGCEGMMAQMMHGNGMGFNWKGLYDVGLIDVHSGWRQRADDLSPTLKIAMLTGEWGLSHYNGRYYAKAQNIARRVRAAYDAALSHFDLLLMPTLPCVATKLPAPDAPIEEIAARAFEMSGSTSPFDVTGHPAISVPCGLSEGLPVGLMLVARHWREATLYRAAEALERSADWQIC
ncbi:amidase [Agrobacterium vitis]|uniref:amidase n=1 Tax=Agrobacterium vitis TaxID=373 RepID=UPI0012E6F3E2|nr:amidase [Agrobacterium vitis]MVA36305.1 amidase [Agrobacterium vitis]